MEKNIFLKQRGKKMVFTCEIKPFRHLTEKKGTSNKRDSDYVSRLYYH